MKKDDLERLNQLAQRFFYQGDQVLFTGMSLEIIVEQLFGRISKSFDDPQALLAHWERSFERTRANMIRRAIDLGSTSRLNGTTIPVITEDVAIKFWSFCPEGPGEIHAQVG